MGRELDMCKRNINVGILTVARPTLQVQTWRFRAAKPGGLPHLLRPYPKVRE